MHDHPNASTFIRSSSLSFFDQLERIGDEEYIPTEADVLRTRVKSTGITETRFSVDRLDIRMFDVGGQRSERKKWIHCFEGVTSVIFVVAVNEYDQVLLEEEQQVGVRIDNDVYVCTKNSPFHNLPQNRMSESLILFETIVLSKWFQRSSIILFFNKIDLFAEKIKRIPLANYFPEYAGKDDFGKACKFMIWRFQQANKPNLPLYPHLTCATDTDQSRRAEVYLCVSNDDTNTISLTILLVRAVFTSVKDTLLNNALRDTGML